MRKERKRDVGLSIIGAEGSGSICHLMQSRGLLRVYADRRWPGNARPCIHRSMPGGMRAIRLKETLFPSSSQARTCAPPVITSDHLDGARGNLGDKPQFRLVAAIVIEISTLIPDLHQMSDAINCAVESAVRAFLQHVSGEQSA